MIRIFKTLLACMAFPIYMAAQNPIINHMYSADPSARVFGDRL